MHPIQGPIKNKFSNKKSADKSNPFTVLNKPESEFSPRPRAKSTFFYFKTFKTIQKYQFYCIVF